MTQPEDWGRVMLTCCRAGCENRFIRSREVLEEMDRASTVALCEEHRAASAPCDLTSGHDEQHDDLVLRHEEAAKRYGMEE